MFFKTNCISRPIIGSVVFFILFTLAGMKYEQSLAAAAQSTQVDIEVLPGRTSKFIDASTRSRVPVAILSSMDFDASTVNPASVRLAHAPITKNKKGQLREFIEDVNGDGRIDLVVYVSVYSLRLDSGTSEASLTATTFDGKSISGSQRVSFRGPAVQYSPLSATPSPEGTVSNSSPITINESFSPPTTASPYPSNIIVSGQSTVTKITVSISDYSHTFPDDVDILLVGPTGATCLLMSDCGGSTAIASPVNITFDDSSSFTLPDNDPIATGTYTPTRGTPTAGSCAQPQFNDFCVPANFPGPASAGPYGTTLSGFNGTDPNGTWKLYVIDDSPGDDGLISGGWSLTIDSAMHNFGGVLDGANCSGIGGWAWDANQPNTPISVDIYDGNTLISTVAANAFRQDLLNAGIGNGFHGFTIGTPAGLKDGLAHTVHAKFAGTSTDLSGSPKSVTCAISPVYGGVLDGANCSGTGGWAWDANQPNTPISVDIYDGNTLISTVAANAFRQDLLNAGIGNGFHGFTISTPAGLKDGLAHTVHAKFAGTSTDLSGSPKSVTCAISPVYGGVLDGANCSGTGGWAWDANQPNTPISVDIYDGNTLISTVAANAFRQDLLNAGIGNGFHGFTISTPASLKDGLAHTVHAKFAGTSTDLSESPKSVTCAPGPVYGGVLDGANCSGIGGWAWDANQPNTPISVDIYDGNTLISTVAANAFRQDLLNAGIGNGFHGFTISTPASLKDGLAHTVHAKFAGTSTDLSESPKSVTCAPGPVYGGVLDGANCSGIGGWAWDANQPNTPINVDIYDGNSLIATVAANAFRQDLLNAGIGNGFHGFTIGTPASLKDGLAHTIHVKFAGTSTELSNSPKSVTCTP